MEALISCATIKRQEEKNVLCVPFIERSFCPPLKFERVFIVFKPLE